jgi:hypothetical protein
MVRVIRVLIFNCVRTCVTSVLAGPSSEIGTPFLRVASSGTSPVDSQESLKLTQSGPRARGEGSWLDPFKLLQSRPADELIRRDYSKLSGEQGIRLALLTTIVDATS